MISVKHLSKVYKNGDKELTVLRDVNCEIGKGEVIGIIGPSGTEPAPGRIQVEM